MTPEQLYAELVAAIRFAAVAGAAASCPEEAVAYADEPVWLRRLGVEYVQGVAKATARPGLLRLSRYSYDAHQAVFAALGSIRTGRGNARKADKAIMDALGVPESKRDDQELLAALRATTLDLRAALGAARAAGAVHSARASSSGLRYVTMCDGRVRRNHRVLEGFVAHADDPVWAEIAPPGGFNCRCSLARVPRRELARRGLATINGEIARYRRVPAGGGWDPGWTGGSVLASLLDA